MYGISWFKGANYYQVKGWLQKRGFDKTSDYGFYDDNKTRGWCVFSNGSEQIHLNCTLKRGKNGKLQCEKVYGYQDMLVDNKNITKDIMDKKALYECIMKNVAIEVKKVLNEDVDNSKIQYIQYIKNTLENYFNCGDDEYADYQYELLMNDDESTFDKVVDYLYDHDDDDYIGRYCSEYDIDFPNEILINDIKKYFNMAYNNYKETYNRF